MKEQLRKLIVSMFALCVSVATTILVLIKGWGLEPKNWFWILGVGIFGHIFSLAIIQLTEDKKR